MISNLKSELKLKKNNTINAPTIVFPEPVGAHIIVFLPLHASSVNSRWYSRKIKGTSKKYIQKYKFLL